MTNLVPAKALPFVLFCSFFACIVLIQSGCASSKQVRKVDRHYQNLLRAANEGISPEEKLDILAQSMTDMMDEALSFLNPEKGVVYVKKYTQKNGDLIEQIVGDLNNWQKDLTAVEKIAFGVSLAQKPYTSDFIALWPKFKRKYNQVRTFIDNMGKFKKGIFDLI